mgnify:CR=1 FL=1
MSLSTASTGRLAIADQNREGGVNPRPPRPRQLIAKPDAQLVPEPR